MKFTLIFPMYLVWHYKTALLDIRRLMKNFTWFIYNFFSIEILLKTWFSPFRRLSGNEAGGYKENIFNRLIVNFLMRVVGFLLRSVLIFTGVVSVLIINICFALFFVVWIFLPLLIPILFLLGLSFFI